jgi:hypothetical protein
MKKVMASTASQPRPRSFKSSVTSRLRPAPAQLAALGGGGGGCCKMTKKASPKAAV